MASIASLGISLASIDNPSVFRSACGAVGDRRTQSNSAIALSTISYSDDSVLRTV